MLHALAAHAQPAPLTLDQAQAEAREHAPERTTADADLAAAKARTRVAGRWVTQDPVLSGRYQQATPDTSDRSWSVGLEWTIDISGAWTPRGEAARATVIAAAESRSSALLDLDVDVALAHAALADAQRRVARLGKMVELREVAMRIATRTRETGAGNQLDVDAATLDLRGSQIDAANARGDLDVARARLARLLGRGDGTGLTVEDKIDTTPIPTVSVTDALVERDPRVRAAAAESVAAKNQLEAERRAARPAITVGIEAGHIYNDIPERAFATMPTLTGEWREWEIGAQLSLPLPLFDRNRVARAGAHADVLLAEAKLARIRADVRGGYAEASARLTAAIDAANAAADIPAVIDREVQLLDKGLRAGGIELDAWAQQARRLIEVGRSYDEAILVLRRARAAWARLLQK
jgi:cobalt-zinc-cadmium efflux system outer membrane protein